MINPEECIDCGVCEPECPAEAIEPEDDKNVKWIEFNREYSERWPNITESKEHLSDADEWKDKPNKMDHFSENPGEGS